MVDAIERSGGRGRFAGTDLAGNPFLAVRFAEAIALTSAEGASDTVVPATLITYSLLVVGGR